MTDSRIDPWRAPWLHQKMPASRGADDARDTATAPANDDPFDPWRYREYFSGTD
jgi:hypothetical protein